MGSYQFSVFSYQQKAKKTRGRGEQRPLVGAIHELPLQEIDPDLELSVPIPWTWQGRGKQRPYFSPLPCS
jgi:hypothetical protein